MYIYMKYICVCVCVAHTICAHSKQSGCLCAPFCSVKLELHSDLVVPIS